jgi:hypothetical protein
MNISRDLCDLDQKDGYVNVTSLLMTNPNRQGLLQLHLRIDTRLRGRLYHRAFDRIILIYIGFNHRILVGSNRPCDTVWQASNLLVSVSSFERLGVEDLIRSQL